MESRREYQHGRSIQVLGNDDPGIWESASEGVRATVRQERCGGCYIAYVVATWLRQIEGDGIGACSCGCGR
jgi:hypothetical protein